MKINIWGLLIVITGLCGACEKYLDAKPDKTLVISETLKDVEALLSNVNLINNSSFPGLLVAGIDDYGLTDPIYAGLQVFDRQCYIWDRDVSHEVQPTAQMWALPYRVVMTANLCLETLDKLTDHHGTVRWKEARGNALFVRALVHYNLSQIYAPAYREHIAGEQMGIPLKTTSDFGASTERATLLEVYDLVLADLQEAVSLLPAKGLAATDPSKWGAHALLSRIYLTMADYPAALRHADAALEIADNLIDYNTVAYNSARPFQALNEETVYYGFSGSATVMTPARAHIAEDLLEMYEEEDLRNLAFFNRRADGQTVFKGQYSGSNVPFMGITTPEVMLTKAECLVRDEKLEEAERVLMQLLENRYAGGVVPTLSGWAQEPLKVVLDERRKELLFRGVRWLDLRRLNLDPSTAVTLERNLEVGGVQVRYELPPNDARYIHQIPQDVIDITGIPQNAK